MGDVKRQLKLLEEKNTTLVQTNMDLEEDVKKTGNWKPQVGTWLWSAVIEMLLLVSTVSKIHVPQHKYIKISCDWQIDVYKRQISELHSKLEAENNRADKSDFETKRLLEKTEALSVERDRLQAERDTLKESNAELQDQVCSQTKPKYGVKIIQKVTVVTSVFN